MARRISQFEEFDGLLFELNETQLAQHLRSIPPRFLSDQGQSILQPLKQLVHAATQIRDITYGRGPHVWSTLRPNEPWSRPGFPGNNAGQPTPPRTPDSGNAADQQRESESKIIDLQARVDRRDSSLAFAERQLRRITNDLAERTEELNRSRLDLATANSQMSRLESRVNTAAASSSREIETLKVKLAQQYYKNGNYLEAAQLYEELQASKAQERVRMHQLNDNAKALIAEKAELDYRYERGQMLYHGGLLADAVREIKGFLGRWKEINNDQDVNRIRSREAQLLLCEVYRKQRDFDAAATLYSKFAWLPSIDTETNIDNRTWILRNAFYLGMIDAEQRRYETATSKIGQVWDRRSRASPELRATMEKELLNLVDRLEERSEYDYALIILAMFIRGNDRLSPGMLERLGQKGLDLVEAKDFERALPYLRRVWADSSLDRKARRKLGWPFAWTLCRLPTPLLTEAEELLLSLCQHTRTSDAGPSLSEIKVMLAYVQLFLNKFKDAEENAQAVFDEHQVKSIVSDEDGNVVHAYNQANILIRALSKQDKVEKYTAAQNVWKKVYAASKKKENVDDRKQLLKLRAEAGRQLASDWRASAKKRNKTPTSASEVRSEAKDIEEIIQRLS